MFTSVKMESRNRTGIDRCLMLAINNIHPGSNGKKRDPFISLRDVFLVDFKGFMCDNFIKIRNILYHIISKRLVIITITQTTIKTF